MYSTLSAITNHDVRAFKVNPLVAGVHKKVKFNEINLQLKAASLPK